jgi:hypothetical protein
MSPILFAMERGIYCGLAIVTIACGCSSGPDIAGTWRQASTVRVEGRVIPVEGKAHFLRGGTFRMSTVIGSQGRAPSMLGTETGKWRLEGRDKLHIALEDIEWSISGVSSKVADPLLAQMDKTEKKTIESTNAMSPYKITWRDDDSFSYVAGGRTYWFVRE